MSTQPQRKFKVLLIGDVGIDEYQYGTVDRISPEAPVPVFRLAHKETKPGMAANVQSNFQALGVSVFLIGAEKSVKTRLIDLKTKQHLVRMDNDIIVRNPITFSDIPKEVLEVDAIVISDYNKGLVTYELVEDLRKNFIGPIFIDTKKPHLGRFNGCFLKINELEYRNLNTMNDTLIVTLGNKGAMYKQQYGTETMFPSVDVEVTDVCGAGDTFLSALVYEYLNTNSIESAIKFANKAASVTVQHVGVYAPTLEEINKE